MRNIIKELKENILCYLLIALFLSCESLAAQNYMGYTVVIDPGHGGPDFPGAIGANNMNFAPPPGDIMYHIGIFTKYDTNINNLSFEEITGIDPDSPSFHPENFPYWQNLQDEIPDHEGKYYLAAYPFYENKHPFEKDINLSWVVSQTIDEQGNVQIDSSKPGALTKELVNPMGSLKVEKAAESI